MLELAAVVESGDLEAFRRHLREHGEAAIHDPLEDDASLLMLAARKGHLSIARELAALSPADVNSCRSFATPLMLAAAGNQLAVARLLLDHGANPSLACGAEKNFPLYEAAHMGHLDMVAFLVNAGARVNARNHCGCTSLMIAASQDHVAVVRYLLSVGASLRAREWDEGWDALLIASSNGCVDTVALLLDNGAMLRHRHHDGNDDNDDDDDDDDDDASEDEVDEEDQELLMEYNSDLTSAYRWTPLLLASLRGNLPLVTLLLSHGANPNKMGSNGATPIMMAVTRGHVDVVRKLGAHRANLNHRDFSGHNVLWAALASAYNAKHRTEIVRELLRLGANADNPLRAL